MSLNSFEIQLQPCTGGYALEETEAGPGLLGCVCDIFDIEEILLCRDDQDTIVIRVSKNFFLHTCVRNRSEINTNRQTGMSNFFSFRRCDTETVIYMEVVPFIQSYQSFSLYTHLHI